MQEQSSMNEQRNPREEETNAAIEEMTKVDSFQSKSAQSLLEGM